MINSLTTLLVFQLIGEVIARALGLPVPGPVIGLALLFCWLQWRGGPSEPLRGTAQGMLQHLSLLFVPAGTGVMLHYHRVMAEWLPISVALILSTLLSIAVTALVLRALAHRRKSAEDAA